MPFRRQLSELPLDCFPVNQVSEFERWLEAAGGVSLCPGICGTSRDRGFLDRGSPRPLGPCEGDSRGAESKVGEQADRWPIGIPAGPKNRENQLNSAGFDDNLIDIGEYDDHGFPFHSLREFFDEERNQLVDHVNQICVMHETSST